MISAQHETTKNTKEYGEGANIVFHINSLKAKGVREFIQIELYNDEYV